jgi:cation transport ATPase
MSQEGATSIQDLQNQPQNQGGENNGSRAVVQEILQEIESNDNKTSQQNNAQQQYNMDSSVQQGSFAPPSQEDSMRMQQEMMMQQQQQQQQQMMQMQMEQQEQQEIPQTVQKQPQSFVEKIMSHIKSPLIVAAIFLLLSLVPTKQLLTKIPRALSETGSVTFIGSAVTAIIAGILFYAVNLATKSI